MGRDSYKLGTGKPYMHNAYNTVFIVAKNEAGHKEINELLKNQRITLLYYNGFLWPNGKAHHNYIFFLIEKGKRSLGSRY